MIRDVRLGRSVNPVGLVKLFEILSKVAVARLGRLDKPDKSLKLASLIERDWSLVSSDSPVRSVKLLAL